MFDHVTIRVTNREASERFYDTVLRTLGTTAPPCWTPTGTTSEVVSHHRRGTGG
jgi:hypothetical protein